MGNREKAEKQILEVMTQLDVTGTNAKIWKMRLKQMNDKEFDAFMKSIASDPKRNHLYLDTNPDNKNDLSYDTVVSAAKHFNVKLAEYLFLPHENPDDPEHPFISATPVPIVYVYMRKMVQMLDRKSNAVSNIDSVNSFTGQVVNDSKAASISDTQTAALTTTGQTSALREFLTIRADNERGKLRMLNKIETDGEVNYNDLGVDIQDMQSIEFLSVMMRSAGFSFNVKKK